MNHGNRKSIRLKGYDYSRAGFYFITICTQNHDNLFGKIVNSPPPVNHFEKNQNTPSGQPGQSHKFTPTDLENHQKMQLNDAGWMIKKWYIELENKFPDIKCRDMIIMPNHFHCIIENITSQTHHTNSTKSVICSEHTDSSLYCVMQWFKTMTTNEYIRGVKKYAWKRFDKKMWQRNYWEHIVRNESELFHISQYIQNNPQNWKKDKLNGTDFTTIEKGNDE